MISPAKNSPAAIGAFGQRQEGTHLVRTLATAREVQQRAERDERDVVGEGDLGHGGAFHVQHLRLERGEHMLAQLGVVHEHRARHAVAAEHDLRGLGQAGATAETGNFFTLSAFGAAQRVELPSTVSPAATYPS